MICQESYRLWSGRFRIRASYIIWGSQWKMKRWGPLFKNQEIKFSLSSTVCLSSCHSVFYLLFDAILLPARGYSWGKCSRPVKVHEVPPALQLCVRGMSLDTVPLTLPWAKDGSSCCVGASDRQPTKRGREVRWEWKAEPVWAKATSPQCTHPLLFHPTSPTKHKFKDRILKNFKTATAEHELPGLGPPSEQGSLCEGCMWSRFYPGH